MSYSSLTFGLPKYNIDGDLLFTRNMARELAAGALYIAITDLKRYFRKNPTLRQSDYQRYFINQLRATWIDLTNGLGTIDQLGSNHPQTAANAITYDPCG
ncbi:hypothetical protein [Robiginitalea marina]|uniref:Uncharacterized protein n=1 Tax=Robiginitalea marina TaxID=2954105 RepID=A0ABT1AY17_9FLAO|nr:hypothetical protein [Robiginitalea marina]MCO5724108.1 hypothetical protein [Robiginitalea marina]